MDDRRPPPLRNPSRTAAKVAVAVLIVIAIAGLVLAGLRSRSPATDPAAAADPTQQAVPPLTVAPAALAEEAGVAPNHISFAPASDRLSEVSTAKVVRIAETAKKQHHSIAIASTVEARADRAEQMELARKRSAAVRQVLQSNGIPLGTMRIEIQEVPVGSVNAAAANQIALVFH
jgi:outer membrane protein OmpA-like peptidoglycan-associated protein